MKKILLSLLICVVLLTSCATNKAVEQVSSVAARAYQKPAAPVKPEMPRLPVEVTPEMDFFKDGYEIVTIESLGDGDTTNYRLKSGVKPTRYLAIDTPETSNGLDPWGLKAKAYVNELLKNAKQIVLERDPVLTSNDPKAKNSTFERYGRLLAHVWVDGELLQYKVVEESLAGVGYLYFDYKYNGILMQLEDYVKKVDNRRIHNKNDKDPEYDYSNKLNVLELSDLSKQYLNRRVELTGIVTGNINGNAYIQSKDGSKSLYCYGKNTKFKAFAEVGNEVKVAGTYTNYNGVLELSNFEIAPVKLSEGNPVIEKVGGIDLICEENMSALVHLEDVKVKFIKNGGTIIVEKDGLETVVHAKYTTKINLEEAVELGKTYDLIGNVDFYNDAYQLVLRYPSDVIAK